MPFTRTWTNSEDDILRNNYFTMPYKELAIILCRSERAVRLRRLALGLEPKAKRLPVNEHFFDTITTPLQAYLIGLLAGDGWVGKRSCGGYGLRFSLKATDIALVEMMRDALCPQKDIYCSKTQAIFDARLSSHLFTVLAKHCGIIPHRKKDYKIPFNIPSQLVPEFVLGYYDAEGSLGKNKRGYFTWSLCGGLPLLSEVATLIKNNLDIELQPQSYKASSWVHYLWIYSLEKIIKTNDWLHRSGLGLQRKNIFNQ